MAEENTQNNTQNNKPKKTKKKVKLDVKSIIFFSVMIIGLIVFIIMICIKPSSKIYSVQYGDYFIVSAEMYSNNKIDLIVDTKGEKVLQSGTYEEIKDDEVENNYTAQFESEDGQDPINVTILVVEDELTITYDDGSYIILKETK